MAKKKPFIQDSRPKDIELYVWMGVLSTDDLREGYGDVIVGANTVMGARRKAAMEICATFPEGDDEATNVKRRYYLKIIRENEPIRQGLYIA